VPQDRKKAQGVGGSERLPTLAALIRIHFRIADTFQSSLARPTGDEQKAVKITVFDLQANPASPGMNFHKLDKATPRPPPPRGT
jgi:hypothetical protein